MIIILIRIQGGGGEWQAHAMYMYPPRYKKVRFERCPPNYFNIKGKKDLTFIKKYDIIKTFLNRL